MTNSNGEIAGLRYVTPRPALAGALVMMLFTLSACGSSPQSTRTDGRSRPEGHAVARVAGEPISLAELDHRVSIEARTSAEPTPRPPDYRVCVTRMRRAPRRGHASVGQLRAACSRRLEELRDDALEHLIAARWIFGEAAREGVSVTNTEAERELERTASALGSKASLANISRATGESKADLVRDFQLNASTQRLFARIDSHRQRIDQGEIAAYYAKHRRRYFAPARRDLEIVAAPSATAARAARRAIEAGTSFAAVVAREPATQPQPILAQSGTAHGLPRGFYKEPRLDDAIFAAREHTLVGPVHIRLGYYVFEVTRAFPPHQRSLNEVRDSIAELLRRKTKAQTRARFVARWRAKWRALTICLPQYVVPKCAQYRGASSEDPYTLS
jgi:foldase protein PrsA